MSVTRVNTRKKISKALVGFYLDIEVKKKLVQLAQSYNVNLSQLMTALSADAEELIMLTEMGRRTTVESRMEEYKTLTREGYDLDATTWELDAAVTEFIRNARLTKMRWLPVGGVEITCNGEQGRFPIIAAQSFMRLSYHPIYDEQGR